MLQRDVSAAFPGSDLPANQLLSRMSSGMTGLPMLDETA